MPAAVIVNGKSHSQLSRHLLRSVECLYRESRHEVHADQIYTQPANRVEAIAYSMGRACKLHHTGANDSDAGLSERLDTVGSVYARKLNMLKSQLGYLFCDRAGISEAPQTVGLDRQIAAYGTRGMPVYG